MAGSFDNIALLDHAQFDQLAAAIPREVFRSLISSFAAACPMQLDQVKSGVVLGDAKQLGSLAHDLKGFAGNFGAARLGALAAAIELRCLGGDLKGIEDLANELEPVALKTWSSIYAHLSDAASTVKAKATQ